MRHVPKPLLFPVNQKLSYLIFMYFLTGTNGLAAAEPLPMTDLNPLPDLAEETDPVGVIDLTGVAGCSSIASSMEVILNDRGFFCSCWLDDVVSSRGSSELYKNKTKKVLIRMDKNSKNPLN